MKQNSIEAYNNVAKKRATNKQLILNCLSQEPNQSRFSVGRKTGLGDIEAQRRLSDLKNEQKVIISGNRKHGDNRVSLYSLRIQSVLFKKKPTLREFIKTKHPEILHKYNALYNHEL